jgi:assimilatory nitrate reductase catalytic subunit
MRLRPAEGGGLRLEGFMLAGDTSAEGWVRALLQQGLPAQSYGRLLLVPASRPPAALKAAGRQVCSCFDVSQTRIEERLADCRGTEDQRLAELQQALRCGTNCGSCVPELRRLVRARTAAA